VIGFLITLYLFKDRSGKAPVIIINLWTLACHMQITARDQICGYRLNVVQSQMESFLTQLNDEGAELLFIFRKNQAIGKKIIDEKESEYERACDIMEEIAERKVLRRCERLIVSKTTFLNNSIIQVVLHQTAKRFGQICGLPPNIKDTQTTYHVQLALHKKALAIIGGVSNYLFYGGDFAIWNDYFLNMQHMTIRQYDREAILRNLQLTVEHLPLFYTLAGGLLSSSKITTEMNEFFNPTSEKQYHFIAEFVKQQKFPIDKENLKEVFAKFLDDSIVAQTVGDIIKNLSRMDLDSKDPKKGHLNLKEKLVADSLINIMDFTEEILVNAPIFISTNFIDFR